MRSESSSSTSNIGRHFDYCSTSNACTNRFTSFAIRVFHPANIIFLYSRLLFAWCLCPPSYLWRNPRPPDGGEIIPSPPITVLGTIMFGSGVFGGKNTHDILYPTIQRVADLDNNIETDDFILPHLGYRAPGDARFFSQFRLVHFHVNQLFPKRIVRYCSQYTPPENTYLLYGMNVALVNQNV